MTIKVTDGDVTLALEAYRETTGCKFWPQCDGMRAALGAFVARHPEFAPQRTMHEPVTDDEAVTAHAHYYAYLGSRTEMDAMREAIRLFLARRAAPVREPVVVTEEMVTACVDARTRHVNNKWPPVHLTEFIMKWMADHLNNKHEKPVDPRMAVFTKAMVERGYDLGSVEDFEFILAKLDNAKT